MYNTRFGVIAEIVCFGIGLLYKNREAHNTLINTRNAHKVAASTKTEDKLITELYQLVRSEPSAEYSIDDICNHFHISRTQLHNRIKNATGQSTSLYIRSIRLDEGRKLLMSTRLAISEIAYAVGFNDPNYFTRTFTKKYGVSPKRITDGIVG